MFRVSEPGTASSTETFPLAALAFGNRVFSFLAVFEHPAVYAGAEDALDTLGFYVAYDKILVYIYLAWPDVSLAVDSRCNFKVTAEFRKEFSVKAESKGGVIF